MAYERNACSVFDSVETTEELLCGVESQRFLQILNVIFLMLGIINMAKMRNFFIT
jgi:hypothetical protein